MIRNLFARYRAWKETARLRRRRLLRKTVRALGVAGLVLAASLLAAPGALAAPRPNILVILADDMGYGDAGFTGQDRIRTPNIDRIAAEGMVFTQFYAGAPVCTPSRSCLMTGLHTGHTFSNRNGFAMRPSEPTVAEVLSGAGYATHFIGKWGLGGSYMPDDPYIDVIGWWSRESGRLIQNETAGIPTAKGFDSSLAFLNQAYAHLYYPVDIWHNAAPVPVPGNADPDYAQRATYIHDLFDQRTVELLDAADGSQPIYLQLSYTIPHRETKLPPVNPYANEDWPEVEQAHAAMITYLDDTVGRILEAVDTNPHLAGNTLVIFTSDNGPQHTDGHSAYFFNSSGPFKGTKRDLYEGGLRAPTAMRWPGVIPPGTSSAHVAAFWDFLPTAAGLAGATVPAGIDGISFEPILIGSGEQRSHDHLYWAFHEDRGGERPGGEGTYPPARHAVRRGDWKLIVFADGSRELYDLATDPGETTNLADQHPGVVGELEALIASASGQYPLPVADAVLELAGTSVAPTAERPASAPRRAITGETVAYWRFEDGTDGQAAVSIPDSSSSAFHAAPQNGPAHTASVPASRVPLSQEANTAALRLDGVSQYAVASGELDLSGSGFTLEAWVALDAPASGTTVADRRWVICKKPPLHPDTAIECGLLAGLGDFASLPWLYGKTEGLTGRELALLFGNGTENWAAVSRFEIADTEWHYLAATHDPASGTVTFRIDDARETVFVQDIGRAVLTGPLVLGANHGEAGAFGQFLAGRVDEVRVSRGALPVGRMLLPPSAHAAPAVYACNLGVLPIGVPPVAASFTVRNAAEGYAMLLSGTVGSDTVSDPRLQFGGGTFRHLPTFGASQPLSVRFTPSAAGPLEGQYAEVWGGSGNLATAPVNGTALLRFEGEVRDTPGDLAALIQGEPVRTASPGDALEIGVNASGSGELQYQWYRMAGETAVAVPGATGPALALNPVTRADFAGFFAVVWNDTGAVASPVVQVAPAPAG
jgi:arylsulfatase A-like enzyme